MYVDIGVNIRQALFQLRQREDRQITANIDVLTGLGWHRLSPAAWRNCRLLCDLKYTKQTGRAISNDFVLDNWDYTLELDNFVNNSPQVPARLHGKLTVGAAWRGGLYLHLRG